jgi:hypothetical protein
MKYLDSPLLRSLLVATTLAIGFGTIWAALAAWICTAIDSAMQGADSDANSWEQLMVRSDGTPVIMRSRRDNLSNSTFHDLSGKPTEPPNRDHQLTGYLLTGAHAPPGFFTDRLNWMQRLRIFINEQDPTILWYFVHDGQPAGAGYFVGYEQASNRRVGFIGLSGSRTSPVPPSEWIPVRGPVMEDFTQWSSLPISIYSGSMWGRGYRPVPRDIPPHQVFVPSGNLLRLTDLANRTVTTVFEAPEPIESIGIPSLADYAGTGPPQTEQPILVRTAWQILALNRRYQVTRTFDIPTEAGRQSAFTWYEFGNGQALAEIYRPGMNRGDSGITRKPMYRIARDGTIEDRFEVVLHNGSPGLTERMEGFLEAVVLPVPALLCVTELSIMMGDDPSHRFGAALRNVIRDRWPSLLVVVVVALALAVLAQRRSRAFAFSRRAQIAWTAFVFLLGLPAYVGFRLHRRWPIRLLCPHCQSPAPRDRTACVECGERFPEPARKGIEIFA